MTRAFIPVALLVALAAGCQYFNPGDTGTKPVGSGGPKGVVEVVIHYPEGQPVKQMVEIYGTPSVLDVTKRVARVETDLSPNGESRVTAIGGTKSDYSAGRIWVYKVNGSSQSSAPNVKYVASGDTIQWQFR